MNFKVKKIKSIQIHSFWKKIKIFRNSFPFVSSFHISLPSTISSTNPQKSPTGFPFFSTRVMAKTELKKKKGFAAKWIWLVVPVIAAIVAISMSSKTCSTISLFGVFNRVCYSISIHSLHSCIPSSCLFVFNLYAF